MILWVLFCAVTSANISDTHPGRDFISNLKTLPRLEKVLVDQAYQEIDGDYDHFNIEVTSRKQDQLGFVPLHKRWVVERTFAWLNRQRRLAKEYNFKIDHQKSMLYAARSKIMLRRLI